MRVFLLDILISKNCQIPAPGSSLRVHVEEARKAETGHGKD